MPEQLQPGEYRYKVTAPDGTKFNLIGPENASDEELQTQAEQLWNSQHGDTSTPPKTEAPKRFNTQKSRSAMSGPEVAVDQAQNFNKGLASVVTGAPGFVKDLASSVGNPGKQWEMVKGLATGARDLVNTPLRGLGALVAPDSVQAPSDEEWQHHAQATGQNAGSIVAGEAVAKLAAPKILKGAEALGERGGLADRWARRQKERPGPLGSETSETHIRRALPIKPKADVQKGLKDWKAYEEKTGVKIHNADEAQEAIDHVVHENVEGTHKEVAPIEKATIKGSAKYAADAEIDNLSDDMTKVEREAAAEKIRARYVGQEDMTGGELNKRIVALNKKTTALHKKNTMGQLTLEEGDRWAEMKARRDAMSEMLDKALEDFKGEGGAEAIREHRSRIAAQINLQNGLEAKAGTAMVERGTKATFREKLGLSKGRTIDKEIADAMRKQKDVASPVEKSQVTSPRVPGTTQGIGTIGPMPKAPTAGKPAPRTPPKPKVVETIEGQPQALPGTQAPDASKISPSVAEAPAPGGQLQPGQLPLGQTVEGGVGDRFDPVAEAQRKKLWTMRDNLVQLTPEQQSLPMTQTPQGETAKSAQRQLGYVKNYVDPNLVDANGVPVPQPISPLNAPKNIQPPIDPRLSNVTVPQRPGQLPMGQPVPRMPNEYQAEFVPDVPPAPQEPPVPNRQPLTSAMYGQAQLNPKPPVPELAAPQNPPTTVPSTPEPAQPGAQAPQPPVQGEQTITPTSVAGPKDVMADHLKWLEKSLAEEYPWMAPERVRARAQEIHLSNKSGPIPPDEPVQVNPAAAPQVNAVKIPPTVPNQSFLSFRKQIMTDNPGVDPKVIRPVYEVNVKGKTVADATRGLAPDILEKVKPFLQRKGFQGQGSGETVLPL